MKINCTTWAVLAVLSVFAFGCTGAPPELNQRLEDATKESAAVALQLAELTERIDGRPTEDQAALFAQLTKREVELAAEVADLTEQVRSYGGGPDWERIGTSVLDIGMAVAIAMGWVRATRGVPKPMDPQEAQAVRSVAARERRRQEGGET